MVKERQDITGSNCLEGVSVKMIVGEKGIKDSWKEYMEKLMNEENEWHQSTIDHRRRTHRGNGSFAPVLLKVPGQTYPFAPVLFGQ